ncbi:MAG: hypothetical protein ACOVOX_08910 [Burkholderiaceae bacterium]
MDYDAYDFQGGGSGNSTVWADDFYYATGAGQSWGNVATPAYAPTFFGDQVESARFNQFTPRAGQNDARPWWERVAEYGLGRYIDNRLGPAEVNNTNRPGTFAGQNGRTYTNVPVQSGAAAQGGPSVLLLAAAAVAALVLLK